MPSGRTNNFAESGRGLGHVTLQFLAVRSAILATAWLLVLRYDTIKEFNVDSKAECDQLSD